VFSRPPISLLFLHSVKLESSELAGLGRSRAGKHILVKNSIAFCDMQGTDKPLFTENGQGERQTDIT